MALSAAHLQFAHQDRMWHVYTPDALRMQAAGGALMHVPPQAGAPHIAAPMVPWGLCVPGLRPRAQVTPQPVLAA